MNPETEQQLESMSWHKRWIIILCWLPTFFKEMVLDTKHMIRHAVWLYRDEESRHWYCTLCNVDLTAIKNEIKISKH